MENSIRNIIMKLEHDFDTLNNHFYQGELERPVITVSPDHKNRAYGWCTNYKAWTDDQKKDTGHYEINICAEYLNRDNKETLETLLHEMVHLYNAVHKIKDTSRSGTYHNENFKKTAEEHGLQVEKNDKYGWSTTTLTPESLKYIKTLKENKNKLHRIKPIKKEKQKKKQSMRKYICPICETIIRATKEVNVICGDCNVQMLPEEIEIES